MVCHVWPSISPWNVWDMSLYLWLAFAEAADNWGRSAE